MREILKLTAQDEVHHQRFVNIKLTKCVVIEDKVEIKNLIFIKVQPVGKLNTTRICTFIVITRQFVEIGIVNSVGHMYYILSIL